MKNGIFFLIIVCTIFSDHANSDTEVCGVVECNKSANISLLCTNVPEYYTTSVTFFTIGGKTHGSLDKINQGNVENALYYITKECINSKFLRYDKSTIVDIDYQSTWRGVDPDIPFAGAGYISKNIYVTVDGRRKENVCQKTVASGVKPFLKCSAKLSLDPDEIDPEAIREIQRLEKEIQDSIEYIENIDLSVINELFEIQDLINSILDVTLDEAGNIIEEYLEYNPELKNAIHQVTDRIDRINANAEEQKTKFEGILSELYIGIEEQYDLEEFEKMLEIRKPIFDSKSALFGTAQSTIDSYSLMADEVISELEDMLLAGDNRGFINRVKTWFVDSTILEQKLDKNVAQTSNEWEALVHSSSRVNEYINKYLDDDLWFKDSPVSEDQKAALDYLSDTYPVDGTGIREEIRTWRGKEVTPEQYAFIQAMEGLSNGIANVLQNFGKTTQRLDAMVSDAKKMAIEGANCATLAVVSGDFGDFYELVYGRSLCTGEALTIGDRAWSAAGLIIGNGYFWRGVANTLSFNKEVKYIAHIGADLEEMAVKLKLSDSDVKRIVKNYSELMPCN